MSGGAERGDDLVADLFRAAARSRHPDEIDPFADPPPMPTPPKRPKAPAPAAAPPSTAAGEPAAASVPVVPAFAERLDGTYGTVAALSMRIESLASALNAVRSTFASQLGEYAETLSRVHRTQVETVDEYRHGVD